MSAHDFSSSALLGNAFPHHTLGGESSSDN